MCLRLYVGTPQPLLEFIDLDIRVERLQAANGAVRQWFKQPSIQFAGAHTHCSCGFPHVLAESPIPYYYGL